MLWSLLVPIGVKGKKKKTKMNKNILFLLYVSL